MTPYVHYSISDKDTGSYMLQDIYSHIDNERAVHESQKAGSLLFPACYTEMFFWKMLQHKNCIALVLGLSCILIQIIEGTAGTDWNDNCYKKNDCYKLLENGKKFAWSEAYDLCHKERGYLLNDTWITVSMVFVYEWFNL